VQHEFRKTYVHSLKEFGGEFLMVVVSILTALALEHGASTLHHRHAAEASRHAIQQELKANRDETRKIVADGETRLKALIGLKDRLRMDMRAGLPPARFHRDYVEKLDGNAFGLAMPTLRREAWEVAVANQTATYIDSADLRRYTAAYSAQRDIQGMNTGILNLMDLPSVVRFAAGVDLGHDNPEDLLKLLNHNIYAGALLRDNLKECLSKLEEAVKE
jgi:hypothetical protein